jgi:hypothetical protein
VVIDTSSLIYLSKIELLHTTALALHLMTVPKVVKAFGSLSDFQPIKLIDLKKIDKKNEELDSYLVEIAKNLQLPIVSEDKKMLMQAKRSGLAFFNTLMIMNFLIFKKVINQTEYQAALVRLREEAYYDEAIFEYGKKIYEKVIEKNMDTAFKSTS